MAALATLLIVGACNESAGPDDDDAPDPGPLTSAEVRALLYGIHHHTAARFSDKQDGPEVTVQCPLGGQATLSRAPQSSLVDWILRHQACRFTARGTTFTITSNLDYGLALAEDSYTVTGAVDWETGSPARQGRCSMELWLADSHFFGTACGFLIDLRV